MIKTFTVEVNSPVINITVIVETVGTVNVIVTNNAIAPVPISGATVTLGAIVMVDGAPTIPNPLGTATTDAIGLAVLNNIPMGTQTGIVTTS